jgi:hypothetical protein
LGGKGPSITAVEHCAFPAAARLLASTDSKTVPDTSRFRGGGEPGGTLMSTAELVETGLSDAEHGAQLCRAVVASTAGTVIEAYDFLLYGLV